MGTFWTTAELLRLGRTRSDIALAARSGSIQPVRKGHWAAADVSPDVLRAARVGGVATATTASRATDLWIPPDAHSGGAFRRPQRADRLQVAVRRGTGRLHDPDDPSLPLRDRPDVVVHWVDPALLAGTGRSRIAGPLLTLAHVFAVQPPERALAVVDSALKARYLRRSDLAALAALMPKHRRAILDEVDPRADSGIETIVRVLLRGRGLGVEVLPHLPGIGEVDLLVEGRLIIECDGREFHDDDEAFRRDRRRDLRAAQGRYRVLRLTWAQVLFAWEEAEAAVFAALAA